MKEENKNKGFVAITTVLILSVVLLAAVASAAFLGVGEGQSGLALSKGEDALNFAEGCMEDALLASQKSNSYTGGTVTRPEGICSIGVSKSGNVWTVTATTTAT